jgi:transposase
MESRKTLTDEQWGRIEPLLPPAKGAMGRPQVPHRPVVEGIVFRYRAGIPWRDLPVEFGPWKTVWKRHHRWSADGTWDRVLAEVLAEADAAGRIDWKVSADSSVVRAHQHGTNIRRDETGPSSYLGACPEQVAGGRTESQDPGDRSSA